MDESSQKARSMLIRLALIVIILLTLLCVGIFLLMSRLGSGSDDSAVSPTVTPVVGLTPTIFELPNVWVKYIDRNYLYKLDYLSRWDIDHEPENDDVLFVAGDGSSMGVTAKRHNYKTVQDYLLALDIERATDNSGGPSVIVEWSNTYNIDRDTEVVGRREKQVNEDKIVIRNYLIKEDDIFIFSMYSESNDSAETSEMFREFLNVIGTFEYRTDRYEAEGTVVTGEGVGKPQCPNGYYLKIQGAHLRTGNQSLLLRSITPGVGNEYPLFQDRNFLGREVKINAIYDTEKNLCTGLSCDCEDFLLIESFE